jgi:Fe-S-cluster containining protein
VKPEKVTAKDCLTCGVCCVSLQDQDCFCDLTPEDEERLGAAWVRRNVLRTRLFDFIASGGRLPWGAIKTKWRKQQAGPLKGAEMLTCVALRGSILHRVQCSVYEKRPRTCREAVKPGDRTCLWLRREIRRAAEPV